MEKEKMFRFLEANEIEVRIDRLSEAGASLILYKNARIDMQLLDEAVGPMRWQRSHRSTILPDGTVQMICAVSIFDETTQEWISKEDIGTPSQYESEKGQASDSFKRACTNWGIGRELYTAPDIFIPITDFEGKKCINISMIDGKARTFDEFAVTQLLYDDKGNITALAIKNISLNKMIFVWDNRPGAKEKKAEPKLKKDSTRDTNQKAYISSSETGSYSISLDEAQRLPVDVGERFLAEKKCLRDLSPSELRWVYGQTKSQNIKTGCLVIAANDEKTKETFISGGIPV